MAKKEEKKVAKAAKATTEGAGKGEAHKVPAPKAKKARVRGLFSINFKFAAFIGFLLLVILTIVTAIIHSQLSESLSQEVAERGATIARNLAAPALEAVNGKDDLTLNILAKSAVEEAQAPLEVPGLLGQIISDMQGSNGNASIKNEGITKCIILDESGQLKDHVVADSSKSAGDTSNLTYSPPPLKNDPNEPFPIFTDEKGQVCYDIASGGGQAVSSDNPMAEALIMVHLYMRRDVVTDAVRTATTQLVAIMLASLMVGLGALVFLVRILMGPIRYLVDGVNAVAAGDFSKSISITPNDEFGQLIDAYNGMTKSLHEKEAVQEALTKYTSKDLVNQMLTDRGAIELGGQRIHATIFFSVIRGLAALAGSMEPEKFVGIMNEYLEIETDIIMKNGGSIDKFIGDEVMAIWGLKGEDVTEQCYECVKAGVEIQDAITKLNARRQAAGNPVFECSAGVNTGEVVSGNMGSTSKMDFTVLGGNVNLAARLGLVAAQGGQTIISHSVYSQVSDRFKIDKLAPMPLKGIKEPVPLYWPRKIL